MIMVNFASVDLPNGWTVQPLGKICRIRTGKKDVNEGNPTGRYPFFTCSKDIHYSDGYSFDTEAILVAGNGVVEHAEAKLRTKAAMLSGQQR
jgi:hypothetical protein